MNRRPTTQDISWFLDLHNNGQLDLNPPYQRRSVWTRKDKIFFLDTIFRDYPCPAIFLYKATTDTGQSVYHVVDGKQRLETIIAFVNNQVAISKEFGDATLDGKKWRDIKNSRDLKDRFYDYVITVEMVKTVEGTVLNNVFDRLNRNSRKLERQELRHAKYDGWLITFAENESDKSVWKELKVVTTARARRMKDVQFISELLLVIIEGTVLGFDQDMLDSKYAEYDNPTEFDPTFAEEEISEFIETVLNYLTNMERHNQCITNYATTFGNFYTLWSVIALNSDKLPEESTLAENYSAFMENLKIISSQEDLRAFFESEEANMDQYKYPSQYFRNAVGASTDLFQREARFSALSKGLGIEDE